ncbi:MAG: tRNA (adenosine(37)-N6)-threonylcarbamoyltransferase complex dimerization subunit type 1 TsaB [Acidimicrobiales bacterium]
MNVLAIETATPQVGVALLGDGGLLYATRVAGGRRHGEVLAPAIAAALAAAGLGPADLTAVAVDRGPGLFTGLRVGLATAKALVDALQVPGVGVTSLDALAHPHRRGKQVIASVVDARRHEVFRALYAPVDGSLVEVAPPAVTTPAELAGELSRVAGDAAAPVLVVGDGGRRYADVLAQPGVEIAGPLDAHPDPAVVGELATAGNAAAGNAGDADQLRPLYLRQADVRIGWEERAGASRAEPAHG